VSLNQWHWNQFLLLFIFIFYFKIINKYNLATSAFFNIHGCTIPAYGVILINNNHNFIVKLNTESEATKQ
jgi:hypothetical protein